MAKRGRKFSREPKTKVLTIRMTEEQKQLADSVAGSDKWREMILSIADLTVRRNEQKISESEYKAFLTFRTEQITGVNTPPKKNDEPQE